MAKGKLSEEEQQILCENPNVIRVNENRIMYSDNFKRTFRKSLQQGKSRLKFLWQRVLIKKC